MVSLIGKIQNDEIIVKAWSSLAALPKFINEDWCEFNALIDTGATTSAISSKARDELLIVAGRNRNQRDLSYPSTRGSINSATQNRLEVVYIDLNIALGIPQESTFRKTSTTSTNWIYHTYSVPIIQADEEYGLIIGMDVLQHCHLNICKDIFILSN